MDWNVTNCTTLRICFNLNLNRNKTNMYSRGSGGNKGGEGSGLHKALGIAGLEGSIRQKREKV
jgi:hypothetical protein